MTISVATYPRDRRSPRLGPQRKTPWTPERDARLTQLWAEGWSTPEIGRRLGLSKGSVVGRAHRLGLPGRPSPLNRGHMGGKSPMSKPHPPARPVVPTLTELLRGPRHSPGRYPARVWTAEMDARIIELRAKGWPWWRIGEAMGLPRQAAQERWRHIRPAVATREAPQAVPAPEPVRVAPAEPPPVAPAAGRLRCQFPMWPHHARPGPSPLFCGAAVPVAGSPYCAAHMRRCWARAA